jgi:hypothetical protein
LLGQGLIAKLLAVVVESLVGLPAVVELLYNETLFLVVGEALKLGGSALPGKYVSYPLKIFQPKLDLLFLGYLYSVLNESFNP